MMCPCAQVLSYIMQVSKHGAPTSTQTIRLIRDGDRMGRERGGGGEGGR